MIKEYKIPTILAMLILVVSIGTGVFLVQNIQTTQPTAQVSPTPRQVRIANISDTSFVVSWITDSPTLGFVSYGKSTSYGSSINNTIQSSTHYAVVDNLSPDTTYYFKIGSGKETFDNSGQPYQVKTAPQLQKLPSPDIAFGYVQDESGSPAIGALVYLTIPGVSLVSTLTDQFGRWSVPLSTARNTSLSSFAVYDKNTPVEIFAQGENVASIKTIVGLIHPVPKITLGKNQDFTTLKNLQGDNLPTAQVTLPQSTMPGFLPDKKLTTPKQKSR